MKQIAIAARGSPLSRVQVDEVLVEMRQFHPGLSFTETFVTTVGDQDRHTSLRTLGKTDFFTREVDELVLSGKCAVAIHSAKDLPDLLPAGLTVIALTKGLPSEDSLVLRTNNKKDPLIATSSVRREEAVKMLFPQARFIDVRGTIHERLALLDQGAADGVVIAEAALIRLGLTHLHRVPLPGPTVEGQGRLAIVGREDDHEMRILFSCL